MLRSGEGAKKKWAQLVVLVLFIVTLVRLFHHGLGHEKANIGVLLVQFLVPSVSRESSSPDLVFRSVSGLDFPGIFDSQDSITSLHFTRIYDSIYLKISSIWHKLQKWSKPSEIWTKKMKVIMMDYQIDNHIFEAWISRNKIFSNGFVHGYKGL